MAASVDSKQLEFLCASLASESFRIGSKSSAAAIERTASWGLGSTPAATCDKSMP
jgi:hypothetical protein